MAPASSRYSEPNGSRSTGGRSNFWVDSVSRGSDDQNGPKVKWVKKTCIYLLNFDLNTYTDLRLLVPLVTVTKYFEYIRRHT